MSRQLLIYFILSILIVIFARYAHLLIIYIDAMFAWVNLKLAPIFSQSGWGLMIRRVLILMLVPIMITAIPAFFYWGIKGREMPHFIAITWMIWLIIVLSDILIR